MNTVPMEEQETLINVQSLIVHITGGLINDPLQYSPQIVSAD